MGEREGGFSPSKGVMVVVTRENGRLERWPGRFFVLPDLGLIERSMKVE